MHQHFLYKSGVKVYIVDPKSVCVIVFGWECELETGTLSLGW